MPLFDVYVVVDWSAASKPSKGANSIWIGCLSREPDGDLHYQSSNPETRQLAALQLTDLLDAALLKGQRVLLGFDFAFGYPAGTAEALGLMEGPAWERLHAQISDLVEDNQTNANNRFTLASTLNARLTGTAHPFWGVPLGQQTETLNPKKGDFRAPQSLAEHRLCEAWIRANFKGTPKSVWQLAYVGSVGSQALLGIPYITQLRARYERAKIWPFETGLRALSLSDLDDTPCLIAEIYPSILEPEIAANEVKDAAQVRALAHHFAEADIADRLATAFAGDNSLSTRKRNQIEQEEGWILAI